MSAQAEGLRRLHRELADTLGTPRQEIARARLAAFVAELRKPTALSAASPEPEGVDMKPPGRRSPQRTQPADPRSLSGARPKAKSGPVVAKCEGSKGQGKVGVRRVQRKKGRGRARGRVWRKLAPDLRARILVLERMRWS